VRIAECVDIYVRIKRESGFSYDSSNLRLRSFVRRVGDIPLEQVSLRQVEDFMDAPRVSDALWQCKYGLLRHFFEYWQSRYPLEQIPMPVKRRALPPRISFPHIYSQAQVQKLLTVADQMRNIRPGAIDVITLRTFLLFLYGTGCLVGEARRIQLRDVDLIRQTAIFRGGRFGRSRKIPICSDLTQMLRRYVQLRNAGKCAKDAELFVNSAGKALRRTTTNQTFQRIRRASGIYTKNGKAIRLNDLRATFVVQRLSSWYSSGADLNKMIPALSAYIGQVGLKSLERYLRLTPDRFRKQLDILSPRQVRKHWRDDAELMNFVAHLQSH
jgi:integrase/recombinase XerD